ncbi:sesquipedalian-2 isoform X3 [Canis lupus familiaris]|nr:sesquipedalian-2 isoform X3 [Canis lupus dingo]XP_038406266.1 sesquipedalian-2 isoform X3 [Canis lupus familiaris]XP_038493638.1 sesquipedalian-2 isoform X3 [Canis lupus familiaris]XP_038535584.1 sesquipedalian-2 isoform X3 [Canis lupus familiaris]
MEGRVRGPSVCLPLECRLQEGGTALSIVAFSAISVLSEGPFPMGCMLEVTRAASRGVLPYTPGLGIVLCPRNHVIKGPSCVARPERPLPSCWELCGCINPLHASRSGTGILSFSLGSLISSFLHDPPNHHLREESGMPAHFTDEDTEPQGTQQVEATGLRPRSPPGPAFFAQQGHRAAFSSDLWPPSPLTVLIGAMKLNERSVAHYALSDSPADHTGFLRTWGGAGTPPTPSGAGRRCWFVLKGNLLFSFESRESRAPLSLVVLEGCTVELAEAPVSEEFAFAIRFDAPGVRPHLLAADGPAAQEAWVKALSRASFGYMRLVVRELESQLRDARHSLALRRHSSWKAGPGHQKPQAPERPSPGPENGHPVSKDCRPEDLVEERGSRPAGRGLAEWQGPAGLFLGRRQSPSLPETSYFSMLHN